MSSSFRDRTSPGWRGRLRACLRSPLLIPLAVFLVSLAAALRTSLAVTGQRLVYAVDDAYIHMAMAKNLARDGVWGCTPFHFSSSSSSPLWTLALAGLDVAFGVRDAWPLLLNATLAVFTLVAVERSLQRAEAAPLLRAVALLGLVVALPLAGLVLLGMEHVLHLLLTIAFGTAAVAALTSPLGRTGLRASLRLGALGALLAASRYEGFFLVGLVCLAFLVRRQLLAALCIGGASCLPMVAFGLVSLAQGSYFLPNSLMLKAAGERVSVLSALLKPPGSVDLAFFAQNRGLLILAVLGLLSALLCGLAARSPWRAPALWPLLGTAMILLHAHFVFSPTFWVYRYDAYLVGFAIVVAAVVLAGRGGRSIAGAWPAVLLATLVAVVTDVKSGLALETETEGMRNTYLEHYQAADFVRQYYAGEVVVVNDLGAVAYYNANRILDLVGLGDVEPLDIMRRGEYTSADVRAWTAPYEPSIAIIQLGWSWIVPRVPPDWIQVAEVEVPPHRHRVGFYAVDPRRAWTLRASVEQHYGPLRRPLGYGVRLLRPPPP